MTEIPATGAMLPWVPGHGTHRIHPPPSVTANSLLIGLECCCAHTLKIARRKLVSVRRRTQFWTHKMKVYQNESTLGTEKKPQKSRKKTEMEITIKWLGSAQKVRVGRVTGNRHIFYFGLITVGCLLHFTIICVALLCCLQCIVMTVGCLSVTICYIVFNA